MSVTDDFKKVVNSALIIHTDSYAGNFEREMHAFCTGFNGEYYPGGCEELAESGKEAFEQLLGSEFDEDYFSNFFAEQMTDKGNPTNVTIARDEIGEYNNVAMLFDTAPPDNVIDLIVERAYEYAAMNNIKVSRVIWETYQCEISIIGKLLRGE